MRAECSRSAPAVRPRQDQPGACSVVRLPAMQAQQHYGGAAASPATEVASSSASDGSCSPAGAECRGVGANDSFRQDVEREKAQPVVREGPGRQLRQMARGHCEGDALRQEWARMRAERSRSAPAVRPRQDQPGACSVVRFRLDPPPSVRPSVKSDLPSGRVDAEATLRRPQSVLHSPLGAAPLPAVDAAPSSSPDVPTADDSAPLLSQLQSGLPSGLPSGPPGDVASAAGRAGAGRALGRRHSTRRSSQQLWGSLRSVIHLGSFVRERRSLSLHERAASTIGLTARKMALSTLLAALIIDMLAHSMLLPVLPFYIVERGGTGADVGVCFSLFALWQGPGAFLAARLSDRVGRKPMLMLAYLGSAVGHALTASASGLLTLYVGRAVLGAFSSAVRAAGVHPD